MEPTKCAKCKGLPTIKHEGGCWTATCSDSQSGAATVDEAIKRWNKFQARRRAKLSTNKLNGGGFEYDIAKEKK
jgi:hypothetical protein